jgi:hypothetical protein
MNKNRANDSDKIQARARYDSVVMPPYGNPTAKDSPSGLGRIPIIAYDNF